MPDGSRKASPLVRSVGWTFIILLIIAFGELFAFVYYSMQDGRFISARARLLTETNKFTAALVDLSKCTYLDGLYPHPYLAYVHKRHGQCALPDQNSTGLFGPEYPSQHDLTKFTILLTGGSVAAQFGELGKGPSYLETELNRCYRPPQGDKFVLLNGADGAWKQPQQTIMYLIYGSNVDAVITLDGFNEYEALLGARLEIPFGNFAYTNPLVANSYSTLAAAWLAKSLIMYVSNSAILNKSYMVYAIVQHLHARLEKAAMPADNDYKQNFNDMFGFPSGWSTDQRYHYNINQYRGYIRAMAAIAATRGAKSAFFIQPVPAIDKVLTPDEKRDVGSLDYARDLSAHDRRSNGIITRKYFHI